MKTRDDIVQKLGNLTRSDRAWIIDRLSPAARSALLGAHSTLTGAPAQNRASGVAAALADANVDQVAAVLKKEPAWIIHALMTQRRPWQDEVRSRLPESLRHELKVLDSSEVRYSRALTESIERKLLEAIATTRIDLKQSRWNEFVGGIGAMLSRKRMNMRMPT